MRRKLFIFLTAFMFLMAALPVYAEETVYTDINNKIEDVELQTELETEAEIKEDTENHTEPEDEPEPEPEPEPERDPDKTYIEDVFVDVKPGEWWYDPIDYVYTSGLMQGVTLVKFAPEDYVTRAMFVTVLARKSDIDISNYTTCVFSDVESGVWYTPYISWGNETGVVNGFENNQFKPDTALSRQDAAVMLYQYAYESGNDIYYEEGVLEQYSDSSHVAPYALEAMKWMVTIGGYNQYGQTGRIAPNAKITRGQMAQVLYNLRDSFAVNSIPAAAVPMPVSREIIPIAHRGSPAKNIPEHSFEAYDNAVKCGARYIEQDLFLSADGVLVVHYGVELKSASGEVIGNIETMKWEEIQQAKLSNGEGIHRLEEVFDRYKNEIYYVIETRYSPRHGLKAEKELLRLMAEYGVTDNVIFQSFYENGIMYIKENVPGIQTMRLFYNQESSKNVPEEEFEKEYIDIYCIHYQDISETLVDRAHNANKKIAVYNDGSEDRSYFCSLLDLGLDGFFADNISLALNTLYTALNS